MNPYRYTHLSAITAALLAVVIALGAFPTIAAAAPAQPAAGTAGADARTFLPLIAGPAAAQAAAPGIARFTASPAQIAPGGASTLAWDVSGATALSISGVGAVTGSSVQVHPGATTEYVLSASNAAGSSTARVTVTVVPAGGGGEEGAVWLRYDTAAGDPLATYGASIAADAQGGLHAAYAIFNDAENGLRPATYAYCAKNCDVPGNWQRVKLGEWAEDVRLLLDGSGRPRLLMSGRVYDPENTDRVQYQYAECNGGCTSAANWALTTVATPIEARGTREENNNRYFAVSPQGMLAFVYTDTPNNNHPGTFFVTCTGGCADAANWTETTLTEAFAFDKPSIAFTPDGQPRIAHGLSFDDGLYLAYAACDAACADPGKWQVILLTKMHGSATYSLQSDAQGRPRLAFLSGSYAAAPFTDHQLYYLWCDAGCAADAANWQFANVGVYMAAGNVDLALNAQGRPRLAFMVAEGLGYGWCNEQCESGEAVWQTGVVESNDSLAENFEVLPIHKCTVSKWINGNRAWLVIDKDGNPRLAYDAQHIWSGVYVDDPGRNCYIQDVTMARAAFFGQP